MPGLALKLIVGLGNPGDEYARTRHNAGFRLVDELARRHGGTFRNEPRHQAQLTRLRLGAADLWLVKPMTYMNRSGGPVASVAGFYKITPAEILVAYDELDLPLGSVRLKEGGGAAGHNGVRDLIAQLGESFWRLRIGIGHPGSTRPVLDHVLSKPSVTEDTLLNEAVQVATDIVPVVLEEGAPKAMNRLHGSREPPTGPGS